jgi:hypothetical protein
MTVAHALAHGINAEKNMCHPVLMRRIGERSHAVMMRE